MDGALHDVERDGTPPGPAAVFFDTETTGLGESDRLCQVAFTEGEAVHVGTYKPPVPISPFASAVHQITNGMVADMAPFEGSDLHARFKRLSEHPDLVFVAHNAPFDIAMLGREGIDIKRHVCTLKVAQHLDVEGKAESYKLQYLRHHLGLEVEAAAHDAVGDVVVLMLVFGKLVEMLMTDARYEHVKTHPEAIREMEKITRLPVLIRKFPFGKYKGTTLTDVAKVDPGYLRWLLAQKEADPRREDVDWIHSLKHHLNEKPAP